MITEQKEVLDKEVVIETEKTKQTEFVETTKQIETTEKTKQLTEERRIKELNLEMLSILKCSASASASSDQSG